MKRIIFLMILLITAVRLPAQVWQWSAPVTEWVSDETGDIWLMAHHGGEKVFNSSVQQINIHIPHRNTGGKEQKITFPEIVNVKVFMY
jgi:hypothetical protein